MMNEKFRDLLEAETEKTIALCQQLIRIPSEDPPGDTREIAAFIDSFFKEAGIASEIVAPHPEKPNVVATVQGAQPGKHVVFNGHIDTFPIGERSSWKYDPFGGEIVDGKMYGRGATDMKGGVAASMMAVSVLSRMKENLPGKVSITCVSDEEVFGPWGSRYLLKERSELLGDALINGEPSSLEHIRIGEKGKHRFKISINTKGGHGAYAGLRANAIKQMINILTKLYSYETDENLRVDEKIRKLMEKSRESYDRILGPGSLDSALQTTMNIGTIHGGIMVNLVAQDCAAELDFRLPPGATVEYLRDWLKRQLEEFSDAKLEEMSSAEPFLTSPDHLLIQTAKEAAEEVCGYPVFENYSLGGTEAYLWRSRGIPGVTYGPSHHNMGSPDEYVIVDELPIVAKVQALTAWRFLNRMGK